MTVSVFSSSESSSTKGDCLIISLSTSIFISSSVDLIIVPIASFVGVGSSKSLESGVIIYLFY